MRKTLIFLIIVALVVVGGYYAFKLYTPSEVLAPEQSEKVDQDTQEPISHTESKGTTPKDDSIPDMTSDTERQSDACQAKCRDQYGGSGSAGFDACIRACGEGGVLKQACPEERPACPEGQPLTCRYGKWICLEEARPAD